MADPTDEKMVPEKDLIALKKGLEKEIGDLKAQIADLTKSKEDEHKARLLGEGAKSALEAELATAKTSLGDLDKVRADLVKATTSRDDVSKAIVGLTRQNIQLQYNLDATGVKALEGKTLEQLNSLSEALELTGGKRPGQRFDLGTGGKADITGLSGREMIKKGLEEKAS